MSEHEDDQEQSATRVFEAPGIGRPTAYRPEFAEQAAKLCEKGFTDTDLAHFFEVTTRTIERWKVKHPDFCRSVKNGKDANDDRVERSLFQRAMGYEQEAVKLFMPAGSSEPVYAKYIEKVPPSDTAAIFWLKNRRPDKWREKSFTEQEGETADPAEIARRVAMALQKGLMSKGNEPDA